MMSDKKTVVYIVISEGVQRLEISGTLDLLGKFMSSMKESTICNPAPQLDDVSNFAIDGVR
jgi:hypothetical protein